jgi:hypothetical protein
MTRDEAEKALTDYQEWVREMATAIKPMTPANYYGSITFHVFKGGVTNIETKMTTRTEKEGKP